MSSFYDANGSVQQIKLDITDYRAAAEKGQSLQAHINTTYPTDAAKYGSTFNQVMESEGIFAVANRELGIRPSTLDAIFEGPKMSAGTIVRDAVPASRVLFPAVMMSLVEDKLQANLAINPNAFDQLVGYDESISGDRYEQPVINLDRPAAARARGIAQLAQPASMLSITTSDKAYKIPTFAMGLEISDQALRVSTLDFVALALARQAMVQRNERANDYILALLNGDVDNNDGTLASLGCSVNASSLDAAATGGTINQRAWMKYLMLNGTKRTLSHLITDFDTAYKIETRTGKPTVVQNDGTTFRFDTQFSVMNPTWAKNPSVFLTDNAAWPAGTIMGLDKTWAVRRVKNIAADYQAIEAWAIRRSTTMRFDFAEHVNRMFPDAFQVLVLA
jgi:hypothetical protein